MWLDGGDVTPPRSADELLEGVLRRGHELRRMARRRVQMAWIGRAAGVVAAAGLAAGLTYGPAGTTAGEGRSSEVAAPVTAAPTDESPSSTAGGREGSPTTTSGPGEAPGSTTTSAPDAEAQRRAPLAVVEQRSEDGTYRTAVLHPNGALAAVTPETPDRQMPVLSPRGDTIAFQQLTTHPLTGQPRWEIFTVGVDGSNLRQVTGGLLEGGPRLLDSPLGPGSRWPSWSPDGTRLAFSCSGPTGRSVICVSRADGLLLRRLTLEGEGFYQPTWSPDGQTIAAKREVDGGEVELWLIDARGGLEIPLPVPRVDPRGVRLSWTADGRELAYAQIGEGPNGVVLLDVASGSRRLVVTPTPARFPIICGLNQVLYLQSDVPLDSNGLRIGPLVLMGVDGSAPTVVLPAQAGIENLPSSCASP